MIALIRKITRGTGYIAALLLVPLIVSMCYEVFARYVFNAPTIWAFELAYILTGTYFLLGMAFTLMEQGHIRIDMIYNMFGPKGRAVVDLIGYLVFLPTLAAVSYFLWNYFGNAYTSGEGSGASAWNPVIWPFRLMFFLGFALLGLQVIAEVIRCIRVIADRHTGSYP